MPDVEVWFVGVECRQRQEAVDEIFGSLQLVTSEHGQRPAVKFGPDRFGPDQQRIFPVQIPLYAGPFAELAVAATVVEHDSGDIEAEKALLSEALSDAATSAAAAYTGGAGALAKPLIDWVAAELVGIGARLLGIADDVFTPGAVPVRSEWLAAADARRRTLRRDDDARTIDWTDVMVVIGRDDGGDIGEYALYLDVRPRQGAAPPRPQPSAPQSVWQGQWNVAPAGSAASAVAAASRYPEQLDAFWVRPDGGVAIRSWLQQEGGWQQPWELAPAGSAASAVAAASRYPEQLDAFWVRPDGGVAIRSWLQQEGGWQQPWELAPAGSAASAVAAASRYPEQLDAFWVRPDGGVAIRSWLQQEGGWQQPWELAPAGSAASAVAAASRYPEQLDAFWVRPDGGVAIRSWLQQEGGWQQPWELAPAGSAASAVAAASRYPEQLDAFWVRPDGGVAIRSWLQQEGGWQQPWELAPAGSAASAVAPASRYPEQLDAFWVRPDGGVAIRSWV